MNKGQLVFAGLLAVVAAELLSVEVVYTDRSVMAYEASDEALRELSNELERAGAVAMRDMSEEVWK